MGRAKRYANINKTKNLNKRKNENNDTHTRRIKNKSNMPKYQKVLLIIFILVFIISGIILVRWYYNATKAEEKYQELSNEVTKVEDEEEVIDFEKLKSINQICKHNSFFNMMTINNYIFICKTRTILII